MNQQINLYQPILRREKKVFSTGTMLQVLGAIAVIMALLYGFNRWQLGALRDEHAQLQAQERELAARVTELTRGLQARPESRELRRRVEAAEREVALKQRLTEFMGTDDARGAAGFSAAFAGLARQRVEGLWLTGIELRHAGDRRDLRLHGRTTRAELVPLLVQQLGREPAFQGLRFRHLEVRQPDADAGGALVFELSTQRPEDAE